MAEGKSSFILYSDLVHIIEKIIERDRQNGTNNSGELFFHILEYVNDRKPEPVNDIVDLTFEPIKQSLKRQLKTWEAVCERNKINGSKGGRPKNPKKPKKASGLNKNPKKPKKADSDSDNDSDNDSESEKRKLGDFEVAVREFENHRRKMRKPMTDRAKELLLSKLEKLAPENEDKQIAILEQSVMNGWLGIFELKDHSNGTPSREDIKNITNTAL